MRQWLIAAGLYRGACITLLRDVPAHAIYFTSYEACHEIFAPGSRASGQPSAAVQFGGGGLAGVLSWLGIYHFDVIKTRLQSCPRAFSPYSGAHRKCFTLDSLLAKPSFLAGLMSLSPSTCEYHGSVLHLSSFKRFVSWSVWKTETVCRPLLQMQFPCTVLIGLLF